MRIGSFITYILLFAFFYALSHIKEILYYFKIYNIGMEHLATFVIILIIIIIMIRGLLHYFFQLLEEIFTESSYKPEKSFKRQEIKEEDNEDMHKFTLYYSAPALDEDGKDIWAKIHAIGGDYIPRRIIELQKEYSASQSLAMFLKAINLEYKVLLEDVHKRLLFKKILDLIEKLDKYRESLYISERPFYPLIQKRNWDILYQAAEKFQKACEMLRFYQESNVIFLGYKAEFASKIKTAKNWNNAPKFDELYTIYLKWKDIYTQYQQKIQNITHLISKLTAKVGASSDILQPIYESLKNIQMHAVNTPIQKLFEQLDGLLRALHNINTHSYSHNQYYYQNNQKTNTTNQGYVNQWVKDLLRVLGLSYPKDLKLETIKMAYRKLAMQHHPDRGGDVEKFKEIQYAYNELEEYLKES